jgi:hypothetical protein
VVCFLVNFVGSSKIIKLKKKKKKRGTKKNLII